MGCLEVVKNSAFFGQVRAPPTFGPKGGSASRSLGGKCIRDEVVCVIEPGVEVIM